MILKHLQLFQFIAFVTLSAHPVFANNKKCNKSFTIFDFNLQSVTGKKKKKKPTRKPEKPAVTNTTIVDLHTPIPRPQPRAVKIPIHVVNSSAEPKKEALSDNTTLNDSDAFSQKKRKRRKRRKRHSTPKPKASAIHQQDPETMPKTPTSGTMMTHFYDSLHSKWIKQYISQRAVTLLIGNSYEGPQSGTRELETLVKKLIENGYIILIEGESKTAQHLADIIGDHGIAISAKKSSQKYFSKSLLITNPYMRMEVFKNSKYVLGDFSSPSAIGLELDDQSTIDYFIKSSHDLLTQMQAIRSLKDFRKQASKFGLGVREPKRMVGDLSQLQRVERILPILIEASKSLVKENSDYHIPTMNRQTIVKASHLHDMKSALEHATVMVRGIKQLNRQVKNKSPLPAGGAVSFGSSSKPPSFEELIYNVNYQLGLLGIPVATGGYGGTMRIANEAAYDAGANSFGVTVESSLSLANENESYRASDVHTSTIISNGYETRIPLLLYRKQIIGISPGGGGTLKELATALFSINNYKYSDCSTFYFIGLNYYEPLITLLQKSNSLPEKIKSNIKAISVHDDPERNVPNMIDWFRENHGKNQNEALANPPKTPRKEKVDAMDASPKTNLSIEYDEEPKTERIELIDDDSPWDTMEERWERLLNQDEFPNNNITRGF